MAIKSFVGVSISCANGVETTMKSLLLVFFSFFSHMSTCFNFVDQTLEPHVLVNFGMYLPFNISKIFKFGIVLDFCTI